MILTWDFTSTPPPFLRLFLLGFFAHPHNIPALDKDRFDIAYSSRHQLERVFTEVSEAPAAHEDTLHREIGDPGIPWDCPERFGRGLIRVGRHHKPDAAF